MRFASIGLPAASLQAPGLEHSPPAAPVSGTQDGGFTLLETLTALTILAIALSGLFQAHATATRSTGTADDYATARLIGEARLAEMTGSWVGGRSVKTGKHGRFSWTFEASPQNAPWAAIKSQENWRLYRLRLNVVWPGGRHVDLQTLKLARENVPR